MTDQRHPGHGVVLLVVGDPVEWTTTTTALRDEGYDVVQAASFDEGRSLLVPSAETVGFGDQAGRL